MAKRRRRRVPLVLLRVLFTTLCSGDATTLGINRQTNEQEAERQKMKLYLKIIIISKKRKTKNEKGKRKNNKKMNPKYCCFLGKQMLFNV